MLAIMKKLYRDEEGQGLAEYALIIALVAVALVISLGALRGKIADVFEGIDFSYDE